MGDRLGDDDDEEEGAEAASKCGGRGSIGGSKDWASQVEDDGEELDGWSSVGAR
jgi:hypothetical protein